LLTICFKKKDYSYALFFGHLTIEKILKTIFIHKTNETPPFSHNLVYIAERASIDLSDKKMDLLEEISDYNLEVRYPDEKMSFYKKCTLDFTKNKLQQIEEMREWLLRLIKL
jgi:HEPN domain-containing protein